MVLTASDELRHGSGDDYNWRESVYFNFNDPAAGIGGWIYLWVVPNKEKPSGMLVSFYKGAWPERSIMDKAMERPGHIIEESDRWLYCFKMDVDHLIKDDFDDVSLCGLRLRRRTPLEHYELSFQDDVGNGFNIDGRFMVEPYDYADGANASPPWVAANRYHRSWRAKGDLKIAGRTYALDCTGDSDHSWGLRDMSIFGANLFKMWSFQVPDRSLSLSAVQIEVGEDQFDLGFLQQDGRVASIERIRSSAEFDCDGVQRAIELEVSDVIGRRVRGTFAGMRSFLGLGGPPRISWGYEGVGDYQLEGVGAVPGLASYFWPDRITPEMLHTGGRR